EQASEFVNYVVNESKMLQACRVIKMKKPILTIAKLYANGDFLHPGASGVALADSKYAEASTDTIELQSKMVRGAIFVTDEERQDNIEGDGFTNKFLQIIARKVANELERIGIYARKIANPIASIDQFDGFKYRVLQDGN